MILHEYFREVTVPIVNVFAGIASYIDKPVEIGESQEGGIEIYASMSYQ